MNLLATAVAMGAGSGCCQRAGGGGDAHTMGSKIGFDTNFFKRLVGEGCLACISDGADAEFKFARCTLLISENLQHGL